MADETSLGYSAQLAVPLSVEHALRAYRNIAQKHGYRIYQEDYEGFEAELYLGTDEGLVVLRILEARGCPGTVTVLINSYSESPPSSTP